MRYNYSGDLIVKISVPLDIKFIHAIEKKLDLVLVPMGFSRETTSKIDDYTEINYRQFGVAL